MGKVILTKGYIKNRKSFREKLSVFYSNLNIKCVVGKNTNSMINNLAELKNVDKKEVENIVNMVSVGIGKVFSTN